jgi:hypothetical protein
LAAVCGVVLASAAAAQDVETGHIIPTTNPARIEEGSHVNGDAARRTIDQFAACTLQRQPQGSMHALGLPSGSLEQERALARLADGECLSAGELRFPPSVVRGSFYTALVRKKYAREAAGLPAAPVDFAAGMTEATDPPVSGTAQLLNFAACVNHHDPEHARQAVIGPAGSAEESAAMAALAPVYGQCLRQGSSLQFSKTSLIGLLAEAYYREAAR